MSEKESSWARTTVVIREEHLEKLKILSWLENSSMKDLFDAMIEEYLSSKKHLDRLLLEKSNASAKKSGE